MRDATRIWILAAGLILFIIAGTINMVNFDWKIWWDSYGHTHVTKFSIWYYVFMIPGAILWTIGIFWDWRNNK